MKTNFALGLRLLATVTAVLACAGAAGSAEQAHAGRPTASIGAQIAGTWRLESIYEEDSGGEDIAQFGPAPNGLFMADGAGNFSFQVVASGASSQAAVGKPRLGMTDASGTPQATAYFGTYVLDQRDRKLTLHVSNCLLRNCGESDRTAEFKIRGDKMELISAAESSPTGASYSHIVWKRQCCR
jgi:Lipocalin-like domain